MLRISCVGLSRVFNVARRRERDGEAKAFAPTDAVPKTSARIAFGAPLQRHIVPAFFLSALCFASGASAADQSLSAQIDNVTQSLAKADAAKDAATVTSLNALLVAIAKTDCDADAAKKVDCKIAFIKSLLGNWTPSSLSVKQQDDLWAAFDPISSASISSSDPKDAITIMTRFSKVTTEVMTSVKATRPETLSNTDDKTKLAGLFTTVLQSIQQASTAPKNIHVMGAWYGDVRQIEEANGYLQSDQHRDGPRFCDATSAVKAFCETQPVCFEPPVQTASTPSTNFLNGNIADITGAKLCGYEPAPYADPKILGLVTMYQCVAITENPSQSQSKIRHATLRGGAYGLITCQGTAP